MINLPVEFTDEVGELFNKITLLTLKDARETLEMDIARLTDKMSNEDLHDFELEDLNGNMRYLASIDKVIAYFGGNL